MVRTLPDGSTGSARTAADMAGRAVVVKLDTERYPEVATRFNVRGIPNFIVFYGGRPVVQQAGLVQHEQMGKLVEIRDTRARPLSSRVFCIDAARLKA